MAMIVEFCSWKPFEYELSMKDEETIFKCIFVSQIGYHVKQIRNCKQTDISSLSHLVTIQCCQEYLQGMVKEDQEGSYDATIEVPPVVVF